MRRREAIYERFRSIADVRLFKLIARNLTFALVV